MVPPLRDKKAPEKASWLKQQARESIPDSQQYPTFCLRHIVSDKAFSLEHRDTEHKAALATRLRILSQMTWAQIHSSPRHAYGCEPIPQKKLFFSLPGHITPDVTILAFRFHKLAPMLGYRKDATLHIICLDADFCAYDHGKK
jgi:hypothetical protein